MSEFEKYLFEAEKEGVRVVETTFKTDDLDGLCIDNVIAISKNLKTDAKRTCVMAEELGHYHTTVGDISDMSEIMHKKQEKRARNWGYEKLIPVNRFIDAYHYGCQNVFELAEYLWVTEDFLENTIQHYKEKFGLSCRCQNYDICFEPLMIIEHGQK